MIYFLAYDPFCLRLKDGEDASKIKLQLVHEKGLIPRSQRFEKQEYYFAYLLEVE